MRHRYRFLSFSNALQFSGLQIHHLLCHRLRAARGLLVHALLSNTRHTVASGDTCWTLDATAPIADDAFDEIINHNHNPTFLVWQHLTLPRRSC